MATSASTAAQPATLLESVRDEIAALAADLEKKAEKGSPRREFVNGLLRDVYVVQQLAVAQPARFDDAAFVGPFVEQFLAKIALVGGFFPDAVDRAKTIADKV